MHLQMQKPHIGLRTVKTAVAVMLAMAVAELYGATDSRLVFAMLGAMLTMEPTFRDAFQTFIFRTVGVLVGAVIGVLLQMLPLPELAAIGIGVVLLITGYNVLRIHYSPLMPCLILVMLFVEADLHPWQYAFGRVWDTAIGMAIGLSINMLVFPYDNSKRLLRQLQAVDRDIEHYRSLVEAGEPLEDDFEAIRRQVLTISSGVEQYSKQKLFLHLRRQARQLQVFRECETVVLNALAYVRILQQVQPEEQEVIQHHTQKLRQQHEKLQRLLETI